MTSYGVSANPAPPVEHPRRLFVTGDGKDGDSSREAWQREMERAQLQGWLSHGVIGHGHAAPAAPMPPVIAASISVIPAAPAMQDNPQAHPPATAVFASPAFPVMDPDPTDLKGAGELRAPQVGDEAVSGEHEAGPASIAIGDSNATAQSPDKSKAGSPQLAAPIATAFEEAEPSAPIMRPARPGDSRAIANTRGAAPLHLNAASLNAVLWPFGAAQATTTCAGDGLVDSNASINPEHAKWNIPFPVAAPERSLPAGLTPASIETGNSTTPLVLGPRRKVQAGVHGANGFGPVQQRAVGAPPTEAIRVHAEWSQQGVALWLGIDRTAMSSLQPIAVQLQRWIAQQGLRLRSISCNGRVLARDGVLAEAFEPALATPNPIDWPPHSTPKEFP